MGKREFVWAWRKLLHTVMERGHTPNYDPRETINS